MTNESVNIDVLYGIHIGSKASDIEYWTSEYAEDLCEKTIIIGDSIQQGFIIMIPITLTHQMMKVIPILLQILLMSFEND